MKYMSLEEIMNMVSEFAGAKWYIDTDDKIHLSNKPPNPFEPVPEDRPEDWREGDEDED